MGVIFFDEPIEQVRYLICDGQSEAGIETGDYAWGNDFAYGISRPQLEWIKREALLTIPDGYTLVVFIHEGITDITYPSGYSEYQDFSELLISFANKEGVFKGVYPSNVDVFSGHQHQDLQTFKNGVLHITTANDCRGDDVNCSLLIEPVARERNSINEQLFDYVVLDCHNDMVKCFRIGGGYDRFFHLHSIFMRAGDKITIEPSLSPVSFNSYNAEGQLWDESTKRWNVVNDIVTVDDKGNVAAQQPGEAVVFAKDENNNKEFFNIKVIF